MVRLYTRTGDSGETYCMLLKKRIRKDHPLIDAIGSIDEANSSLGLARALVKNEVENSDIDHDLEYMQRLLFRIGFSFSGKTGLVTGDDVKRLEEISDKYMNGIELKLFILPSGSPASAALHVARSVTRRAERAIIRAFSTPEAEGIGDKDLILKAVNRLSDALFAIAVHVTVKSTGKLEYVD